MRSNTRAWLILGTLLLVSLTGCGGGGGGDDGDGGGGGGSQPAPDPGPTTAPLIGAIPQGVSYTLTYDGQEIDPQQLEALEPDVYQPVAAYSDDGDLIYWGNGQVYAVTQNILNGRSTATMLVYTLLVTTSLDPSAQAGLISSIDQHPSMEALADKLTALVQTHGYMNLDAADEETFQLASTIIDDVRTLYLPPTAQTSPTTLAKNSFSSLQKTGEAQVEDGSIVDAEDLSVAYLGFEQIDNDIKVNVKLNNTSKVFYETSIAFDQEDTDSVDKSMANIVPRDDVKLLDIGSSLLGLVTFGSSGNFYATTDLALSKNTSLTYTVPKTWALGLEGAGRHWLIADPKTALYPKVVNLINLAVVPISDLIGIKLDTKDLGDSNSALAIKLTQFALAHETEIDAVYEDLIMDSAWGFIQLILNEKIFPDPKTINNGLFASTLRWGATIFNFAGHVTATNNILESLATLRDGVETKRFLIDPVPVQVENVNELGNGRYQVTVSLWGTDTERKSGDSSYELKVYGFRSLTNIPGSDISELEGELDFEQSFTFSYDSSAPTHTIEIEVPENVAWISVVPGFDAPCIEGICNLIDRPNLFLTQTPDDRPLASLGQNLISVCNGERDQNDVCWKETYYDSGPLKTRSPYVNGYREGVALRYYENGKLWQEIPYARVEGIQRSYRDNGDLVYESPVIQSVIVGNLKTYDDSGYLISDSPRVVFEGAWTGYRANGNIQSYETRPVSVEQGLEKKFYYSSEGEQIAQETPHVLVQSTQRYYSEDGSLRLETVTASGLPEGVSILYFEDGGVQSKTPYVINEGLSKRYYEGSNDLSYEESSWSDSTIEGTVTNYYESGNLSSETPYVIVEGLRTRYDQNGDIEWQIPEFASQPEGIVKRYSESGVVQSETPYKIVAGIFKNYVNGAVTLEYTQLHSTIDGIQKDYYASGNLYSETPWVVTAGEYTQYNEDGTIHSEGPAPGNVQQGIVTDYFDGGGRQSETPYEIVAGVQIEYHDNGTVRFEQTEPSAVRSGIVKEYYESGTLRSATPHVVVDGTSRYYKDSGAVDGVYPAPSGEPEGIATDYYESGVVSQETPYVVIAGLGRNYDQNGKLTYDYTTVVSVAEGIIKQYYASGSPASETPRVIVEGITSKNYWENGNLYYEYISASSNVKGVVKEYYESGVTLTETPYDLARGIRKNYYDDGTLQDEYDTVLSAAEGVVRRYHANGKLQSEAPHVRKGGVEKGYHANGNTESEGPVLRGLQEGTTTEYFDNGATSATTPYVITEDIQEIFADGGLSWKIWSHTSKLDGTAIYYDRNPSTGTVRTVYTYVAGDVISYTVYNADGTSRTYP